VILPRPRIGRPLSNYAPNSAAAHNRPRSKGAEFERLVREGVVVSKLPEIEEPEVDAPEEAYGEVPR
jgi:hypothetical protein